MNNTYKMIALEKAAYETPVLMCMAAAICDIVSVSLDDVGASEIFG